MIIEGSTLEAQGALEAARAMCLAARTAPKARGRDFLSTLLLDGEDKEKLAAEMQRIGEEAGAKFFVRDAGCVRQARLVLLLGTRIQQLDLPECGFCGYRSCKENREHSGICAFNTGDLGIALGSAVSKAADLRVDTRVMFTAGRAALNLKLLGEEVRIAYGIPLSVSGKNPFFDRKP